MCWKLHQSKLQPLRTGRPAFVLPRPKPQSSPCEALVCVGRVLGGCAFTGLLGGSNVPGLSKQEVPSALRQWRGFPKTYDCLPEMPSPLSGQGNVVKGLSRKGLLLAGGKDLEFHNPQTWRWFKSYGLQYVVHNRVVAEGTRLLL